MQDAGEITVADYKEALSALWYDDKVSENQMTWLQAHYRAPGRVITAKQLAKLVGYKHHGGVNLWFCSSSNPDPRNGAFRAVNGIAQQHGNRHRANAAGDRGNG